MKKKILISLVLGLALLTFALPILAQEEVPDSCTMKVDLSGGLEECPDADVESQFDSEYLGGVVVADNTPEAISGSLCCLFSAVYYAVNWILPL